MQTIYLVGQISPKYAESYEWRKNVVKHFEHDETKHIIDPCNNPFNKQVLEQNRYAISDDGREYGIDVLPPKDLTYINRCDIAIVNLTQYDPNKELLGSYFELAWLYMNPQKAVIAFANDLQAYNCKHPFVTQSVHVWCHDEEQACYVVDKYFIE